MAFFLRKALKLGPLRLNLSKSGVGPSIGVTGARIGLRSSDGQPYVYGGRYGLYYRRNLGSVDDADVSGAEDPHIEAAAEAIAELLHQTREEWLPALQTARDSNADASARKNAEGTLRLCSETVVEHLKAMGFPVDTDGKFAGALSEIQSDLMLKAAFPETYEKWDETCGEMLGRAGDAVQEIIEREKLDARTLSDSALRNAAERGDEQLFNKLYAEFVAKLSANVIVPELKARGLWSEENPLYEARLGGVVTQTISDAVERLVGQRQRQRRG